MSDYERLCLTLGMPYTEGMNEAQEQAACLLLRAAATGGEM